MLCVLSAQFANNYRFFPSQNPEKEIEKLAEFLEVQTTKQTIKDIAMATAFDNMQKNKFDITKIIDGEGFIYRKGGLLG